MGVFVLSSSLNFVDRNLLAALALPIEQEFGLDDQGFGYLISAFSLAYALSSPVTGYLLDRLGLNRASTLLVGFWSLVGLFTAGCRNLAQLTACRIALGIGESGGIPAVAKMGGIYLQPEERALGSALGQVGITIGTVAASTAGVILAGKYGWRRPFLITGLLGLLWIPLWLAVGRPKKGTEPTGTVQPSKLDKRLIALVLANVMWMGVYSLWTDWTTLYLQRVHHLSLSETASYAWIPAVASNAGGFLGGWLALKWIGRDKKAIPARLRVILLSALGTLFTLVVPYAPGPGWGSVAIALSFFWILAGSVNIYTLPVDLYGAERAGRAISALVFAYGMLQTVISPLIGRMVKTAGFGPVCWAVSLPPLIAWLLLKVALKEKSPA